MKCPEPADLFEYERNTDTPKADLQEVTGQKAGSEIMLFNGIDNSLSQRLSIQDLCALSMRVICSMTVFFETINRDH